MRVSSFTARVEMNENEANVSVTKKVTRTIIVADCGICMRFAFCISNWLTINRKPRFSREVGEKFYNL